MRDVDKVKTRFELKLDSSQVFFLFLGLCTYSALLFVLGVVVGRSRRADDAIAASRPVLPDASPAPTVTRIEDRLAAVEPKATEEPELPLGFYENLEKGTTPGVAASPTGKGKASPSPTPNPNPSPSPKANAKASPNPNPSPNAKASANAVAKASPIPSGSGKGAFTLQVVSYGEEAQAEGEVSKLTQQGYKDVFVTQGSVAGKTVHRVRIGHYLSKAEAEQAALALAADNPALKPIVVPLE